MQSSIKESDAISNLKVTKSTSTTETPAEIDSRGELAKSPPSIDANESISDSEDRNEHVASKLSDQLNGEKHANRKDLKKRSQNVRPIALKRP